MRAICAVLLCIRLVQASEPEPAPALATMPVKEVTVFKDGHAFVIHEGSLPVSDKGEVLLDLLPAPVLGTFWPYALPNQGVLKSVTASTRQVKESQKIRTIAELIEANAGAEVTLTDVNKATLQGTIVEVLNPPVMPNYSRFDGASSVLLLKTADGTKAVNVNTIQDVKFAGKYTTALSRDVAKNTLSMKLDFAKAVAPKTAGIGLAYVQLGLRWIPHYKIELDEGGNAVVSLQATLVNDLIDLNNVSLHLVVGVPSFTFKDITDPIALNQVLASVAAQMANRNFDISNLMMGQQIGNSNAPQPVVAPAVPDVVDAKQSDDLYVFSIKNVTLAKGARMVVPISEHKLKYRDVYTLELNYQPPPEVRHGGPQSNPTWARLMNEPKVQHKLRLKNSADQPLTTAPALILKSGKVLSQGMMLYTSKSGEVDIALTTAINIKVERQDVEKARTPANDLQRDNWLPVKVNIASRLTLFNAGTKPVEVEVTRTILGTAVKDDKDAGLKAENLNLLQDDSTERPVWWSNYSWPNWWTAYNGIGQFKFTLKLEPGKSATQNYAWFYIWR